VASVGVIPAAGYATRLQPLDCSKEVYPIHGRPVMDFLVERMRRGGCSELRVVTRPEKRDVVDYARAVGARVIEDQPSSPGASLIAGLEDLAEDDLVLFGYPDSIWEPADGFRPMVDLVAAGTVIALGLFRTEQVDRPDVVTLSDSGIVTAIDVGSEEPPSNLMWGCAAARARALEGLREHEDPGGYFASLCHTAAIRGVTLSDSYLDIGTGSGLRRALASPAPAR
jgi:glucose-1-phosphate thymidylyltransferase